MDSTSPQSTSPKPSDALLVAALAGLLGFALTSPACGSDPDGGVAPSSSSSSTGTGGHGGGSHATGGAGGGGGEEIYERVISDGKEISPEKFQKMCDDLGGWVYVTAYCAGSAMCKGLSMTGTTLTEHSCKAINACGGVGCVVMPADSGLTGKDIYKNGPCSGCHGDWTDYDHPNLGKYTVVHGPDLTDEEALERFEKSTDKRLRSIVVFGVHGVHDDGTPFSNMPPYYQKYSVAEIERVVEYVRSLPTLVDEYDIYGSAHGGGPGGGGAGPVGAGGGGGAGGAAGGGGSGGGGL